MAQAGKSTGRQYGWATLIHRYKRFLADIELDDGLASGEIVTAHCTNSGSMKSCIETDAEVYLSQVGLYFYYFFIQ
jgi:DNA-binding sugar fermentation-stimulating protein